MPNRIGAYYRRRITRAEPPPYRQRALVFTVSFFIGALAVLLLAGNPPGESILFALLAGLGLGLVVASILPVRLHMRKHR